VDRAADLIEEELGPIDIWINGSFATIFARFRELTPEEFRRATEVTYLGAVYGTMVALKRMRPRGRGTIIQIGSALAKRSIPLQSAYCGAKHGIDGFTESLRTELLHDHSGIHVIVVQMPGVNTPQFSRVRSLLTRQPRPVAPVYPAEIAARAVLYAAKHPMRKQYWVGGSTVLTLLGQRTVPAVLDRYLAAKGFSLQQTTAEVGYKPGNLFSPLDDDAHDHSAAWRMRCRARTLTTAAAASTAAIIAGGTARARRRPSLPFDTTGRG
jgi:short-subunit dehydrogenase